MELMDFFFPEQAEAAHLRSIARSMRRGDIRGRSRERKLSRAAQQNEDDVGFLALTLLALVGTLVDKGVLTEAELFGHLRRLDALDGVADGKLAPDALRGALGLAREPAPDDEAPEAPTPTRRRRRR